MRGGLLLGISFGAAALAYIMHHYNFKAAVWVQSSLLLLFTTFTFLVKLEPNDPLLPRWGTKTRQSVSEKNPAIKTVFRYLWQSMTAKQSLQTFGIIATVYLCFSIFIRSIAFHFIQVLHWPDQEVSVLQGGWGSLVTLGVVLSGGILADRLGPQLLQMRVLSALTVFLLSVNLLSAWWDNRIFATAGLLFWNVADPLFSVAAFPILMTLCKDYTAGSQFTAYMAFINLSDVIGAYLSGWALSLISAPVLGFCCGLILLSCLFYLYRINATRTAFLLKK